MLTLTILEQLELFNGFWGTLKFASNSQLHFDLVLDLLHILNHYYF